MAQLLRSFSLECVFVIAPASSSPKWASEPNWCFCNSRKTNSWDQTRHLTHLDTPVFFHLSSCMLPPVALSYRPSSFSVPFYPAKISMDGRGSGAFQCWLLNFNLLVPVRWCIFSCMIVRKRCDTNAFSFLTNCNLNLEWLLLEDFHSLVCRASSTPTPRFHPNPSASETVLKNIGSYIFSLLWAFSTAWPRVFWIALLLHNKRVWQEHQAPIINKQNRSSQYYNLV